MILEDHPPSRRCDCPECRAYFDFLKATWLDTRATVARAKEPTPLLDRNRAQDRPHLRDTAFLKFMAKVVGNTLRQQ